MPAKKGTSTKKAAIEKAVETPDIPKEDVATERPTNQRKNYDKNDRIVCRSVTVGELICTSPKNHDYTYRWSNYGDVCEVEYQDLLALKSRKSQFIYMPAFIIEDEQVVDEWKLTDVYNSFYGFDDIDTFFTLSAEEMQRRLREAPQGLKEAIKGVAAQYVKAGRLDSIQTIKAIDSVIGTNLLEFIK